MAEFPPIDHIRDKVKREAVAPKIDGVISVSSTDMQIFPNQAITISDENAHLWAPVLNPNVDAGGTISSKHSPTGFRHTTRSTLVFRLRASGLSHEDIAVALHADETIAAGLPIPYGPEQVADDISAHLKHLREEIHENLQDVLTLEVERFDMYLQALWPAIMAGDTQAITTALKVSERRSRMLGLDRPLEVDYRVELADMVKEGTLTLEDVEAQIGVELFGEFVNYLETTNVRLLESTEPQNKQLYSDYEPGGRFSSESPELPPE